MVGLLDFEMFQKRKHWPSWRQWDTQMEVHQGRGKSSLLLKELALERRRGVVQLADLTLAADAKE